MFKKSEKIGKGQSSNNLTRDIPLSRSPESLIDNLKADKNQYELTDVGVPLNPHGFLSSKRSGNFLQEKDFQAPVELEIIPEESNEEEASKSEFTPF
ncbi:TPA: hypothetical protein ACTXXA_003492 [Legionella anisa]